MISYCSSLNTVALDWLKGYLSNRRQSVSYNGILFDIENISCGIPQGSVFGPLLFQQCESDHPLSRTFAAASDTSVVTKCDRV